MLLNWYNALVVVLVWFNLSASVLGGLEPDKSGVSRYTGHEQSGPHQPNELMDKAKEKSEEMSKMHDDAGKKPDKKPGMMAGFNQGDQTVFGSSQKGGGGKPNHHEQTNQALKLTGDRFKENIMGKNEADLTPEERAHKEALMGCSPKHNSNGKCAEQAALDAYFKANPNAKVEDLKGGKMASYGKAGEATGNGPTDACKSKKPGQFGCHDMLETLGITDCAPEIRKSSAKFRRRVACKKPNAPAKPKAGGDTNPKSGAPTAAPKKSKPAAQGHPVPPPKAKTAPKSPPVAKPAPPAAKPAPPAAKPAPPPRPAPAVAKPAPAPPASTHSTSTSKHKSKGLLGTVVNAVESGIGALFKRFGRKHHRRQGVVLTELDF